VRITDPWGQEGIAVHSVMRLKTAEHFQRFHIPPGLHQAAIFQHEDYSDWPEHSALEVATIGAALPDRPPDKWVAANDNRFIEYGDDSTVPYILATFRAVRLRGTIGYGVAWTPLEIGQFVEQRIAGFNVHAPGFKPKDLEGAIEALAILGGIKPTTVGRHRLEDLAWWRTTMKSIDVFMKSHPGTPLEFIVDKFRVDSLADGDYLDDILDTEARGEDPWQKKKEAAVAKLKRWLGRWRKLVDENSGSAEFT